MTENHKIRRAAQFWIYFAAALCGVGITTAQEESNPGDVTRPETGLFFDKAHGALETALQLFDQKQDLPANEDLAFYDYFSRTKESQQQRVDSYLDVAAEALGLSPISRRREKIARIRDLTQQARARIDEYRRLRISAPDSTYNPLNIAKSGYDSKIKREEERIKRFEQDVAAEKSELVREFQQIGLTISPENIDVLLESITGDEFVRLSIIFDNAKNFAVELERLTNETGEDLETAKKYYGVYLMLLHTIDRLQNKFVEKVDNEYYPQLEQYIRQAHENIESARQAIQKGGDRKILEDNIYSNEITLEAANIYKQSLGQQKYKMGQANEQIKRNILTATNTYNTAVLSKDIASLIAVSRRAFDSISRLTVPDLRPFENVKMKDEFSRLAREIRGQR
jgi:hypothetical protein